MTDFLTSQRVVVARPASRVALWWASKRPDDIADYDVDWTWHLYSAGELANAYAQQRAGKAVGVVPADKIVASLFLLPVGTLEGPDQNPSTFVEVRTKVWLAGGDDGLIYTVVNRVTTAAGRTMDQNVQLKVKTK
ncbi:hypothetical protein ACRQ5Q_16950 [Bradyrhizobium sp. PMVTL-01]|uniref:phage fiber-tail adaptor protein n=1 Tax=Bradyrhizobium sp. PMVTL-01 TaxID=3434999 RepID=UPI003F703831